MPWNSSAWFCRLGPRHLGPCRLAAILTSLGALLAEDVGYPVAWAAPQLEIASQPQQFPASASQTPQTWKIEFVAEGLAASDLFLEAQFVPPAGPNQQSPPKFFLNDQPLASIGDLFPQYQPQDRRWKSLADGSREFDGRFVVRLPVDTTLRPGTNSLRVEQGRPDDAFAIESLSLKSYRRKLRVLAWNVESGVPTAWDPHNGNDPSVIARELFDLAAGDYDVVGLSEVHPDNLARYVAALTAGGAGAYRSIHSATGLEDRLVLIYNTATLRLIEGYELHASDDRLVNSLGPEGDWRHRSPLVAKLVHRDTNLEFACAVNHLARGDELVRNAQAAGLTDWAQRTRLPVIALGDFNFDYEFATEAGNPAWFTFTQAGRWKWIRPQPLVDSNWADRQPGAPLEKRQDQYPGSILDFVFVAGRAQQWPAQSTVVVRDGDFPDTAATSDHRPVSAEFVLPLIGAPTSAVPLPQVP
jgi:endonuclease/exonuclease/phosphatase family metal-dependent hydrolase